MLKLMGKKIITILHSKILLYNMVNVLKLRILLLLFSTKILVFRAGINKMLVRIANREDPDLKKQSDLGLH